VKIADFGLAILFEGEKRPERITQSNVVLGTPSYMAPEQMERPMTVDHRADIYSLGVVFYEMLTGELPMGRFLPPSQKVEVDVRLDEVVLRALEKEREMRYQRVTEVRTDLEGLRYPARIEPKRVAPIWPWIVVGVVAVVGLGGLFLFAGAVVFLRTDRSDSAREPVSVRPTDEDPVVVPPPRKPGLLPEMEASKTLDPNLDGTRHPAVAEKEEEALRASRLRQTILGSWKGIWKSTKFKGQSGDLEIDVRPTDSNRVKVAFKMSESVVPGGEAICEVQSEWKIVTLSAKRIKVGGEEIEASCTFIVMRKGNRGTGSYRIEAPDLSDSGTFEVEIVE